MKKRLSFVVVECVVILLLYAVLLRSLVGTNIVAGILCPGDHLPWYYPGLILLFLLCRIFIVLLPGILLYRIGRVCLISQRRRRTTRNPACKAVQK